MKVVNVRFIHLRRNSELTPRGMTLRCRLLGNIGLLFINLSLPCKSLVVWLNNFNNNNVNTPCNFKMRFSFTTSSFDYNQPISCIINASILCLMYIKCVSN